jgi:hypothetical protein
MSMIRSTTVLRLTKNPVNSSALGAGQPGSLRVNLELLYRQLQDLNRLLTEYNQQIEELAQTERYQKPVGKHPNKVKVACARELVGFVWESLRLAAA